MKRIILYLISVILLTSCTSKKEKEQSLFVENLEIYFKSKSMDSTLNGFAMVGLRSTNVQP